MMKRTSVLDFLGVVRIVGYSLAIVPALIAVVLYLIGYWWPLAGFIVGPFLGPVIAGLPVAWIAWLSRMLVRRMHFARPQDCFPEHYRTPLSSGKSVAVLVARRVPPILKNQKQI